MSDSTLLLSLVALRPYPTLLPRLESLTIHRVWLSEVQFPLALALAGSTLRRICIADWLGVQTVDTVLRPTLASIPERFPNLEVFSIGPYIEDWGINHNISKPAAPSPWMVALSPSRLGQLTKFECRGFTLQDTTFNALAWLPCLRYLAIRLPRNLEWSIQGPPARLFPRLQRLTIITLPSSYITFSFLVALPRVQEVYLELPAFPTSQALAEIPVGVARQFSRDVLTAFSLRMVPVTSNDQVITTCRTIAQRTTATVNIAFLQLLSPFSRLVHLDVSPPAHFQLSDANFYHIARAWPALTSLVLADGPTCIVRAHPSLAALAHFAEHAPQLRALALPLTIAAADQPPLPVAYYGSALRTLVVCDCEAPPAASHRAQIIPSVAFVARCFPQLDPAGVSVREYTRSFWGDAPQAVWWREVAGLLPIIRTARKTEQRAASAPVPSFPSTSLWACRG